MFYLNQTGSNALIVGTNLTCKTVGRLADLMGLDEEEFDVLFDRAYLTIPSTDVIQLWDHCLGFTTCRYDWVLLLGRHMQHAFRQSGPWMKWNLIMPQALHVAALPHPNKTNATEVEKFLSDWRNTVERQRTTTDV